MNAKRAFLSIALLMGIAQLAPAGDHCCPDCGSKACHAIPEVQKVKKHCYKVECKQICIPKFRWPWEKCCKPECGKVINVRVLKKVDYECEKCGYKWEITCCGTNGGCTDAAPAPVKGKAAPTPAPPAPPKAAKVLTLDYFRK